MTRTNIVGGKHSFTYNAWKGRYDDNNPFKSYVSHAKLVKSLLDKIIPEDEASIVPLWNSNSGLVDMDQKTKTAELFLGKAGNIVDLWPSEITYGLGVKGDTLSKKCNIYSVKVASNQCCQFLMKLKVHNTDRFNGYNTTTEAGKSFQMKAAIGDGLLCPKGFLKENAITTKNMHVTNPYNTTIFSTINSLPRFQVESKGEYFSLGCIVTELNGNELPPEFGEYWESLFPLHQAEESTDCLYDIPKILFILRYEQSKALMLLEMPTIDSLEDPWPEPERETDVMDGNLETLTRKGQVGLIRKAFCAEAKSLFLSKFKADEDKVVFYGLGETYIWASPGLNIFVHGFDPKLVKECALLQVLNLKRFLDYGISLPATAKNLLKSFGKGRDRLKLSPDSQPDTV